MGKLITVNTDEIMPSQDFIKEGTVKYILECINNNKEDKLPPTPIVRNDPDGSGHIAIDGHNLIIVYEMIGRKQQVYLAESKDDELKGFPKSSHDAIIKRNEELKVKYDSVLEDAAELKKEGITSFKDLRKKYDFLKDLESAKKYYNLK